MAEPARTWPIGKTWSDGAHFAEPAAALQYAACTGDTSPVYHGEDAIVPPMFHVRLFLGVMRQIVMDPELGLDALRLVHGEHDATFHRPIRPWDLVHVRARLEAVEEKESGIVVSSRIFGFVDGVLAVETLTRFFVRAERRTGAKKSPFEDEYPKPSFEVRVKVPPDLSRAYAVASLDDNPIHVDAAVARAAGHPDVILQGLCTMAMTGAAAIRIVAKGDARRLKRLAVRFVRPVVNDSELIVWAWPDGLLLWELLTMNGDWKPVLSHGVLELYDA